MGTDAADAFEAVTGETTSPKMGMPGRRLSALVVDADEATRQRLRTGLVAHGIHVAEAASGEEAWRLLFGGYLPGVIILDIGMPDLDGFRLMQELKAHRYFAGIPVIVHSSDDTRRDYAIPWVLLAAKPAEVRDLVDLIRRYAQ